MIAETIELFRENENKKNNVQTEYMCIALGMNKLTYNIREMFRQEQLKIKFNRIKNG